MKNMERAMEALAPGFREANEAFKNSINWIDDMKKCQNPGCPNGHRISITIFRGSGYCSDNCRKALGLDPKPDSQTRH